MGTTSLKGGTGPGSITTRQEFATALTTVREAAGLTVREVARAANIHPSTAGGYFSGRHLPPLRPGGGLRALLVACGITDADELDDWQSTLARIRRAPGPRPSGLPSPYLGLVPYGPGDAERFHGRDEEIRMVLRRLASAHADGGLLVILGAAGIGKTSLLAAGVVARLRADPDGRPVIMLAPGRDPLRALAQALATPDGSDPDVALAELRRSPGAARELVAAVRRVGADRQIVLPDGDLDDPDGEPDGDLDADDGPPDPPETDPNRCPGIDPDAGADGDAAQPYPVLVVDQLEQLFTDCPSESDRQAFVAALAAAARPGPRREPADAAVVVALRSEFLRHAARFPDLVTALRAASGPTGTTARTVPVRAPATDQLRAIVLEPARKEGLIVEDGLVDLLLADLSDLPSPALALLSHALLATWRRGQRSRLTAADYRASGALHGSVELAAEAAYRSLDDSARPVARELLGRLGRFTPTGPVALAPVPLETPRSEGPGTSQPAGPTVQPQVRDLVLRAFTDVGLVCVNGGRVGLVSSAAIDAWPRLAGWVGALSDPAESTSGWSADVAEDLAPVVSPAHGPGRSASDPAGGPMAAVRAGQDRTDRSPAATNRSGAPNRSGDPNPDHTGWQQATWWAWRWLFVACGVASLVVAGVAHELWR
jgi:transcriptional regulator with XRE-family HTH domain